MNVRVSSIVMMASLLATPAFADSDTGWLFGVGAGQVTEEYAGLKGSDMAYQIFGGYRANRFLGVELGYIDGGKPSDRVGGVLYESRVSAGQLSLLPTIPLGEHVSLFGRAGLLAWNAEVSGYSDSGTALAWGVGAQASIGPVLFRVELEQSEIESADLSFVSGNLVYRF